MSTQPPTPTCVRTVAGLRRRLDKARAARLRIGLVPTMGALHAGHRSLVRRARARDDFVAVSVFVNPLQFGPNEDYDDYPRDLSGDLQACADEGADLVFAPERTEMYPEPPVTVVSVGLLARVLCGTSRPGHFDGVATVIAKLFAVAGECSAYFGEKDFQQLSVIRRVVVDLSLPVTVVGCPTVREPDGLALSSRNAYLGPAERAQAPVLLRALEAGAARVRLGETDPDAVIAVIEAVIATAPLAELEYAAAVPERDLTGAGPLTGRVRLLAAARFGRTRLIDNVGCAVGSARQTV